MTATLFEIWRQGYFDIAFGNMLKAIRGGANPIGVTTLAMCGIGALSTVEWALNNEQYIGDDGGLVRMTDQQKRDSGCFDQAMFRGWLDRWIVGTGLNNTCDSAKVYATRCALVHTGGGSDALLKIGLTGWEIRANSGDRPKHYTVQGSSYVLYMPDLLAELMLATDQFLNAKKSVLNSASSKLSRRIAGVGIYSTTNAAGQIVGHTVPHKTLDWFDRSDELNLWASPLVADKIVLADRIQAYYQSQVDSGLVLPS